MAREQAFAPGEYIADELRARGWSQTDFAKILGRPFQHVNLIVNDKRRITPEIAVEIAAAFGTSAEIWLKLQASWDVYNAPKAPKGIAQRAKRMAASA